MLAMRELTLPSDSSIQPRAPRRRDGPTRTCIGCRRVAPASELLRCRIGADQHVVVVIPNERRSRAGTSTSGDACVGRGAWVCGVDCIDLAINKRAFDRAFRRRVDTTGLLGAVTAALVPVGTTHQPGQHSTGHSTENHIIENETQQKNPPSTVRITPADARLKKTTKG